jgi:hypothetical protein
MGPTFHGVVPGLDRDALAPDRSSIRRRRLTMKRSLLIVALGGLLVVGPAVSMAAAQATPAPKPAPKEAQPATKEAKPHAAPHAKAAQADMGTTGARTPLAQPNTEPPSDAPAGDVALGTVRVPRKVMADGKPLDAGSYQVRLTSQQAEGKATGATAAYERYVEFLQGGKVKGREVASIVPAADAPKVAKDKKPAPGSSKVELLKGNDYMRVWINRGGTNYLIHLAVPAAA